MLGSGEQQVFVVQKSFTQPTDSSLCNTIILTTWINTIAKLHSWRNLWYNDSKKPMLYNLEGNNSFSVWQTPLIALRQFSPDCMSELCYSYCSHLSHRFMGSCLGRGILYRSLQPNKSSWCSLLIAYLLEQWTTKKFKHHTHNFSIFVTDESGKCAVLLHVEFGHEHVALSLDKH